MWIEKVAKYHNDWLKILYSFGADYYAEDIVQEMYITLIKNSSPEKALRNNEVYFPYVYRCLRNSYLNYLKKKNKITKINIEEINLEHETPDYSDKIAFEDFSEKIRSILLKNHWYHEKLYDIYTSPEDPSFRTLAKDTDISFMTIYNDFKNIKKIINDNKEKLQDEWDEI